MIWTRPTAFVGFLFLVVVFMLIARNVKKKQKAIASHFSDEMFARLIVPRSKPLSIVKHTFLFLAFSLLILVLAAPKSLTDEPVSTQSFGRDVFILFDVSDSMLAEDLSPNRLSVAKLDVEDLLDVAVGDRIGLIAFAGSAQVEIPLTTDYVFFRNILREVDTSTVRMGGTAIGDAIRLALERFGSDSQNERAILLVTDGEDHDSLPLEAARNAEEQGVPIFVVALGDLNGAKAPIFDADGRRVGYKQFDGQDVVSKPDVPTLKEIARISKGKYYYADVSLNFADVYKNGVDALKRGKLEQNSQLPLKDDYQPFLFASFILFLLYYVFPIRTSQSARKMKSQFISIVVCLISCLIGTVLLNSSLAYAQDKTQPSKSVDEQKIETDVEPQNEVEYPTDLTNVTRRQERELYNKAVELAGNGRQEEAKKLFETLSKASDQEIARRSNFNLGVAAATKAKETTSRLNNLDQDDVASPHSQEKKPESQSPDAQTKDPVKEYNQARQKRTQLRQELSQNVQESVQRFNQGVNARKKTSRPQDDKSLKNIEIVSNWHTQQENEARAKELEQREKVLSTPDVRLQWLKGEVSDHIRQIEKLGEASSSQNYQTMFVESRSLPDLESDVKSVASQLSQRLQEPNQQTIVPNTPTQDTTSPDSEGVQKINDVQCEFIRLEQEAAGKLSEYQPKQGLEALKRANAQLSLMEVVPSPYDQLILNIADTEEKATNQDSSKKSETFSSKQVEEYYWDRFTTRLTLSEAIRKAQKIVEQNVDLPSQNRQDVLPKQPDVDDEEDNSEESSIEVASHEEDEIEFDPNPEPKTSQTKSREEKILESSKLALERQEELNELLEKMETILHNKEKLSEKEENELKQSRLRLSQLLQEIVRPLKDENQQNQNQQDQQQDKKDQKSEQNKEQKNQDSDQNKGQNQNSQVPQNDQPSQKDKPEQNKEEQNSQQEKKEESQPEEESRDEEKSSEGQEADLKELSEEEKEANALIRLVERRQKDAEKTRKAVRKAMQKRERSGKDW